MAKVSRARLTKHGKSHQKHAKPLTTLQGDAPEKREAAKSAS